MPDHAHEETISGPRLRPVLRRLALELGPLLAFFAAFQLFDIWTATAVFMAATVLVAAMSIRGSQGLPLVPIVSTFAALVMGGLTIALDAEQFIKMRPTLLNGIYATIIAVSALTGHNLLKRIMADSLHLDEQGWRYLTWSTVVFLVALAGANEFVWRSFSTNAWVNFKTFAVVPADAAFMMCMWPLVKRHWDATAASRPRQPDPHPGD